jgi:hypothetical protein
MSVRTVPVTNSINWRKLFAVIAQIASWFTTLWFVQWLWPEGALVHQALLAVLAEGALVVAKERLFTGDDPILGWAGFIVDGIVNAGGILPKACRVLSFPPIAALVAAMGGGGACATFGLGSVLFAIAAGALLSVLPHRLWRGYGAAR